MKPSPDKGGKVEQLVAVVGLSHQVVVIAVVKHGVDVVSGGVVGSLERHDDVDDAVNDAVTGGAIFGRRLPARHGRAAAGLLQSLRARVAEYPEVEDDGDDARQERDEEQDRGQDESQRRHDPDPVAQRDQDGEVDGGREPGQAGPLESQDTLVQLKPAVIVCNVEPPEVGHRGPRGVMEHNWQGAEEEVHLRPDDTGPLPPPPVENPPQKGACPAQDHVL